MTIRKSSIAIAAVLALSAGCGTTQSSPANDAGSDGPPVTGQGIGDPYYPDDGNLGYDAKHYGVALNYYRPNHRIVATTTIKARSTARLKQFHFDLLDLKVTRVLVDGKVAAFSRRDAHELVIKPKKQISKGSLFTTKVTYHGVPGRDPVGAVPSGWYDATTPGAGFIAGEPHSCTVWYPCNDHPTDKATFSLAATVPRPFSVISNGAQLKTTSGVRPSGQQVRTFRWRLGEPTATYLTTIYIDVLTFERSTLADGTPVVSAYGPNPGEAPAREALLPEILRVLARHWGHYPAPQAGGIFVSGEVPFSLETFTRPIYTEGADVSTIVHENGHQWWGDNVSIKRWRDICLNECLASYSQWLWDEHKGADLDEQYRDGVADEPDWFDAPIYDMGAGHEFDFEGVYLKGSFFVHALRNKIGDAAFFKAMKAINREHAGGNLSMLNLRDRLEAKTSVDLTSFWRQWVLSTGVPSDANLYPGDL